MRNVMKNLGSRSVVSIITFSLLLITLSPWGLMAAEVGRFTRVEGQVGLYKGKTPTPIPAQPQTAAEANDRIKTEALSRAQLKFVDASTLTVAPLSDVTIESYMYDKKTGLAGALSQVTRGLAHFIVNPLAGQKEQEFIVNTSTAVMGVRGTEFYVLIGPDFTDVYVKTGRVSLHSKSTKSTKIGAPKEEETAHDKHLRRSADIRAAKTSAQGETIIVTAMTAGRATANAPAFISGHLSQSHFNTLQGAMNTGLPQNLKSSGSSSPASSIETLSEVKNAPLPMGYTPPGAAEVLPAEAPPAAPVGVAPSFPGGGGGGEGVASPSS
jgi:hypothetical protein